MLDPFTSLHYKGDIIRCFVLQGSVLNALQTAVRDCKNYKVRINAALSLSISADRRIYGSSQTYAQVCDYPP